MNKFICIASYELRLTARCANDGIQTCHPRVRHSLAEGNGDTAEFALSSWRFSTPRFLIRGYQALGLY